MAGSEDGRHLDKPPMCFCLLCRAGHCNDTAAFVQQVGTTSGYKGAAAPWNTSSSCTRVATSQCSRAAPGSAEKAACNRWDVSHGNGPQDTHDITIRSPKHRDVVIIETIARSDLRIIGVQFRACNENLGSVGVVCDLNSFHLLEDDERRYVVRLERSECKAAQVGPRT